MKKTKGIFISFEGPEASGKSTQILLLKNYLKLKKISYVITREPGGTEFAENLRKLILRVKNTASGYHNGMWMRYIRRFTDMNNGGI